MTRRLTGSRLPIFMSCGWWARSDVSYEEPVRDMTHANRGTDIHTALADAVSSGLLPEDPETLSCVRPVLDLLESIGAVVVDIEAAWAYDPKTRQARKLGNNIGREYDKHGALPGDICASFDLVVQVPDWKALVVIDYKSGYGEQAQAGHHAQLTFASLCYAPMAERLELSQKQEIWYTRPGKVWVDSSDVDVFGLGGFEAALQKRLEMLPYLPAVPGEHCTYCPAAGGCPATSESIGRLVDVEQYAFSTAIEGPAHAAWMIERLPMIEKAAETVKEALKRYADEHGGVLCSDGKVWKAVDQKRSGLNMPEVKAFLGANIERFQTTHEFKSYRKCKA